MNEIPEWMKERLQGMWTLHAGVFGGFQPIGKQTEDMPKYLCDCINQGEWRFITDKDIPSNVVLLERIGIHRDDKYTMLIDFRTRSMYT